MRTFIVITALALLPAAAEAERAYSFRASLTEGWTITFPKGEVVWKPTTTAVGFGAQYAIKGPVSGYTEVGLLTPNTVFTPFPRVFSGFNFRLASTFAIGVNALYQLNALDAKSRSSHLLAFLLVSTIPLNGAVVLQLVVAVGATLDGTPALTFAPRVSVKLPF